MSALDAILLAVAAALGGALNSVAGGGSFLTFPALIFAGVPPVTANATSAVALWPAAVAAAFAYRERLRESESDLVRLSVVSVVGGLVGAVLLLRTPNTTFSRLLPYLLLAATLVFTFGKRLGKRASGAERRLPPAAGVAVQLAIAVYGGYFGGGMGIVMLAALSATGMTNIHAMNALKTVLGALINLVAIGAFIVAGAVAWRPGVVMVVAGTLGGYLGARTAQKIDPTWVRRFVLAVGWGMTAVFFWRAYTTS